MAKPIGKVTHFYGKVHAAVIDLAASLKQGEAVTFDRGSTHFTQVAESIQIDHVPVERANKGDCIGLEVGEDIKPGATVYRGEALRGSIIAHKKRPIVLIRAFLESDASKY